MSYGVFVKKILDVSAHPNADRLDLLQIDGYQCIARRGEYQAGDIVVYIPEQSIVPEGLLKKLGLWDTKNNKGMLAGSLGDRVKPVRLRGIVSQGLVYKPDTYWAEGAEVSSELGIQKYVVPVPVHLCGEVFSVSTHQMPHFDVDNIKSFPDRFVGRQTVVTEKLHGTFCGVTVLPVGQTHPEAFGTNKNILIFSKGLGSKGLVFKNNERNQDNLYVRAISEYIGQIEARWSNNQTPVHILGEIVGKGVQDLSYTDNKAFFVFAVCLGFQSSTVYLEFSAVTTIARQLDMLTVPVLHTGVYDNNVINQLTNGKTTLGAGHIREGVVVWAQDGQPKALKSISDDYLFRRNGTEYN